MNRTLLTLCLAAVTTGASAQGTIAFANGPTQVVRFVGDGINVAAPEILSSVELVWAEQGVSHTRWNGGTLGLWLAENPGWQALTTSIQALSVGGRFNAGFVTAGTASPGGVIQAIVIGWYTPSGAVPSFDAAVLTPGLYYAGFSTSFTIDTANPLAIPVPELPPLLASTTFDGILYVDTPEPTTFSLASLGAVALLVFRRRR